MKGAVVTMLLCAVFFNSRSAKSFETSDFYLKGTSRPNLFQDPKTSTEHGERRARAMRQDEDTHKSETQKINIGEDAFPQCTSCDTQESTICKTQRPTHQRQSIRCPTVLPSTLKTTRECKYARARSKKKNYLGKTVNCEEELAPCHPAGGVPKSIKGVPILHFDPNFEKVLSGELPERIVSVIIKKSSRNEKVRTALGQCYSDLDQLGEDLMNQPLETEGCCTKLKGELRSFLAWLLEQDPTRRRREASQAHEDCPSWVKYLSNASLTLPSSFYGLIQSPFKEMN